MMGTRSLLIVALLSSKPISSSHGISWVRQRSKCVSQEMSPVITITMPRQRRYFTVIFRSTWEKRRADVSPFLSSSTSESPHPSWGEKAGELRALVATIEVQPRDPLF
jgi:hypothetical protein